MASVALTYVVLLGVLLQGAWAQWGAQNSFGQDSLWGGRGGVSGLWGLANNDREPEYLTCIGKSNVDEMRVTFTVSQESSQMWWRPSNRLEINMEALISIGGQSQTRGQYQLVVTEYGRVEDGCLSVNLGRVVDRFRDFSFFFRQQRQPNSETGVVGTPFALAPSHGHNSRNRVVGFDSAEDLLGRGMALCMRGNLRGGSCLDLIPLCCKIGRDNSRATTPVHSQLNQIGGGLNPFGQPAFGGQPGLGGQNALGGLPGGATNVGTNPGAFGGVQAGAQAGGNGLLLSAGK